MRHYIDKSEVWIPDRMVQVGKKKKNLRKHMQITLWQEC
jgi:hypothetical protein